MLSGNGVSESANKEIRFMNAVETYKQKSFIPAPFTLMSKDDMYASSIEPIPRFLFLPMVKVQKGRQTANTRGLKILRKSRCLANYHESATKGVHSVRLYYDNHVWKTFG